MNKLKFCNLVYFFVVVILCVSFFLLIGNDIGASEDVLDSIYLNEQKKLKEDLKSLKKFEKEFQALSKKKKNDLKNEGLEKKSQNQKSKQEENEGKSQDREYKDSPKRLFNRKTISPFVLENFKKFKKPEIKTIIKPRSKAIKKERKKELDPFVKNKLKIPDTSKLDSEKSSNFYSTSKFILTVNMQYQIDFNRLLESDRGYKFKLPHVRFGIDGEVMNIFKYRLVLGFDDAKFEIRSAQFSLFPIEEFSISFGKLNPLLIRETRNVNNLLFGNLAPIYVSLNWDDPGMAPKDHPGAVLGIRLGGHFFEKQFNIYLTYWNKNFDFELLWGKEDPFIEGTKFKQHSIGLRLEYDVFRPWDSETKWFFRDTTNLTIGIGIKYVHENWIEFSQVPLSATINIYIDSAFKFEFFYTQLGINLSVSGDIYFGMHLDIAFIVTAWFMPALRYFYQAPHVKYTQLSLTPNFYGANHGLTFTANFYPFFEYDFIGHRLKIQLGGTYHIVEPEVNLFKKKNKAEFFLGALFDL